MSAAESSGDVGPPAAQEFHILLVAAPQALVSTLEQQPGYRVQTVASSAGALDLALELAPAPGPDGAVDLVMVSRQGLEQDGFAPLVMQSAHRQKIPVIVLIEPGPFTDSGQPMAGATDYLVWPSSIYELLARVRTGLELAQRRRLAGDNAAGTPASRAESASSSAVAEADTSGWSEMGPGVPSQIVDVLESITDGFFSLDRQWRFTYLNRSSEALSGKSRQDLLGKVIWQVFPGLVGTNFELQLRRALVEQVSLHFEAPSVRVGLWREVHVYPRSEGLAVYWRDITQRRLADQALRLSESRYRTLANAVPQLVWINDSAGSVEFLNQRWAEYTGLSSEAGASLWQEAIYPDDFETVLAVRSRAIAAGEAYEIECRLRRFDQSYRWHLVRVVPLKDAEGKVLQWFGSATDIDGVKQSEAALRASEANAKARADELEVFMATVPAAVWIAHDPHCHYMTANQAAHKLVEQPVGATVTATPADGNYPFPFKIQRQGQDIPLHQLPMQKAGLIGEEVEEEFDFVFENGEVRAIWGRAVPLRRDDGQVRGVIGVFLDISDRKRVEQEREQLLERERLARAEAETANRLKDEFLAVLSHELRSPLNPILGWARLLQSRSVSPETLTQALQSIERNVRLQVQLVEDLLDVSRILRGKLVLEQVPVDLSATVQAAIETVLPTAVAKGVEIVFRSTAVAPVQGDAGRLQQVIWNLLSNAVKFTPTGGRVEVRLEPVEGGKAAEALAEVKAQESGAGGAANLLHLPQAYAQITVSDTGRGIAAEFLPHVFDYFRQQDSTTTRQFGGLGIGLAIVSHLTEMHSGRVTVASAGEGLGATFTVLLPCSALAAPIAVVAPAESAAANPLQGRRVLVVDDDPDTRQFVAILLGPLGATVTTVDRAQAALVELEQAPFDLLISDIGMPEMDGYQLMQAVRRRPSDQGGQMGAIAMTAYAGEQDEKRAKLAGFDAHLAKPVAPDQLLKALIQLLERRP